MATEMKTLTCPVCGREIQVPGELEAFSCVYCGAKLHMTELLHTPAPVEENDRIYAEEHLLDCIRNYPAYFKNFGRKTYPSTFSTYRDGIEESFRAMDRYICAQPARREELMETFVDRFLSDWEAYHRQRKGGEKKSVREKQMFDSKLTLAWYTVPAILDLGLSVGSDFTELLQRRFVEQYPNNVFQCGTYADISSGFQKRKLCFITTAVCRWEGKPDDCAELTAFRAFRDGWLSRQPDGQKLIDEYYDIAPAIVQAMRYADNEAARCAQLRREYLLPCYTALRDNAPDRCKELYIEMVQSLKQTYFET